MEYMTVKDATVKRLKIYTIFVTACAILVFLAFCVVFHRAGYDTKVLVKLGIIEPVPQTDWAVVGWNNTLEKLGYDSDVVFFGDSITRGSDFREYFPELKIVNLGFPGDSLLGMIDRVSGVVAVTPEKVFVLGGINGLKDENVDYCIAMYGELLDSLIENLPTSQIFVQSVLPISSSKERSFCHNTTIVKFNARLEQLAAEKGLVFVDFYSLYELSGEMNPDLTIDGIHLYPEAYALWADAIAKHMK